jgi:hypothetical protein
VVFARIKQKVYRGRLALSARSGDALRSLRYRATKQEDDYLGGCIINTSG